MSEPYFAELITGIYIFNPHRIKHWYTLPPNHRLDLYKANDINGVRIAPFYLHCHYVEVSPLQLQYSTLRRKNRL